MNSQCHWLRLLQAGLLSLTLLATLGALAEESPPKKPDPNAAEAALQAQQEKNSPNEAKRANTSAMASAVTSTPRETPIAGKVFKDCADCPEMVVLPAGSFDFVIGDATPHKVTLKSFALGKTEVTQAQWQAVMGRNPSHFTQCGPDCPVENVSWDDVQEFIRRFNAKTHKTYHLPSETEWEYACRAGGRDDYCGSNDLKTVAWYGAYATPAGNSAKTTSPAATKQANAWGLYDMSGNVWEWVQDCWNDDDNSAPADGSAWEIGYCARRVLRGGSWAYADEFARVAYRGGSSTATRSFSHGFRLAKKLP